ncbi:hypothetical protein NIES2135_54480 [Leptolyngbya boryana NIES-2135]|jgi:hypothetical protein|uniref:Uncharacterized protein n=2 Tax=Leptolyngbya boryana TaxID=1184 RepID=A0A1Z4JP74_LEPBY|nr:MULTISPECIES: hypothetical protein [Leptolyngbya]BAY58575.1 hypothetical protein NIES2135_54480 [Leptolyngbya boryana NIES-2135]MBD2370749.1 hypothetical protein [Leptolyngbya sp. FACHB-161]MBD2377098.1 hypothetical protein [Leptolyngbya sp. FACHB-238]MBD2401541.1 hypothetical protein [Leptolyngbya sp. FACHB-239]MBD2408093.1 hypothetical protein [Leptolyngbya sp. FACHB-402]
MIRPTSLRHCHVSKLCPQLWGKLGVVMQQPSGANPVATLLGQILGNISGGLGTEILRSDRRAEIYISDEKFNLDRIDSGWRCSRTPV